MASKFDLEATIAVIGLGNLGNAIANTWRRHNLSLLVWNRTSTIASDWAQETEGPGNPKATDSLEEAISQATVIVICVSDF